MDKDIKYLLLPDVHGRDFWMKPVHEVLENSDAHIVFLGDFLDPYKFEWDDGVDYQRIAIERFKEIIELKKANPDRITLLLGNHDASYAIDIRICECRTDYHNYAEIEKLFKDNRELFQLGIHIEAGGKEFDITHAGIFKEWAISTWGDEAKDQDFDVIGRLNKAWLEEDYKILDRLGVYDHYRGWGGVSHASPVWSDIRSWVMTSLEDTYHYNIVGHTMSSFAAGNRAIMCIDCKQAFYIDNSGEVKYYNTDKEVVILGA